MQDRHRCPGPARRPAPGIRRRHATRCVDGGRMPSRYGNGMKPNLAAISDFGNAAKLTMHAPFRGIERRSKFCKKSVRIAADPSLSNIDTGGRCRLEWHQPAWRSGLTQRGDFRRRGDGPGTMRYRIHSGHLTERVAPRGHPPYGRLRAQTRGASLHAGCVQTVAVRRAVSCCHSMPARLPLRQYASTGFGSASTSAPNASTSASPIRPGSTGR